MAAEKKIKIIPGGPYEVTSNIPLKQNIIKTDREGTSEHWAEGREYDNTGAETYHLCRCGHSKNKPYCDGSHTKIAFDGKEHEGHHDYLQNCKVYEGGTLDLYDNESLCSSMRFCDRAKGVWQAAIDSADPASRQLAIEESCACAAGRLTVRDKATGEFIEPDYDPEIGLVEDTAAGRRGPLAIKGDIELEGADGRTYEKRNRRTLCRCGESKNMPYCDISHMRCTHMEGFDE